MSKNELKIKIFDLTPPCDDFEYLRPQGRITFSIGRKYNVRLWPKHTEQKEHFSLLQRTPLQTPGVSSSSDSGFDTVF